jgi:hypothetical protein
MSGTIALRGRQSGKPVEEEQRMWGEDNWGQMIWNSFEVMVPSLSTGGLVIVIAALVSGAVMLMRRRASQS